MQRLATPLTALYCPTRRPAIGYVWNDWWTMANAGPGNPPVGRSDYTGNSGVMVFAGGGGYAHPYPQSTQAGGGWNAWPASPPDDAGPLTLANGGVAADGIVPTAQQIAAARVTLNAAAAANTSGVIYRGSLIRMSDITNGASDTYLAGEKKHRPGLLCQRLGRRRQRGRFGWRQQRHPAFHGDPRCAAKQLPSAVPGHAGMDAAILLWQRHLNGFHAALCDGAVRLINYSISPVIHAYLSNRQDGHAIDAKQW